MRIFLNLANRRSPIRLNCGDLASSVLSCWLDCLSFILVRLTAILTFMRIVVLLFFFFFLKKNSSSIIPSITWLGNYNILMDKCHRATNLSSFKKFGGGVAEVG